MYSFFRGWTFIYPLGFGCSIRVSDFKVKNLGCSRIFTNFGLFFRIPIKMVGRRINIVGHVAKIDVVYNQ